MSDASLTALNTLMYADLKKSGLTPTHAKGLGYKAVSAEYMQTLSGRLMSAGYELPYRTLLGTPTSFSRYKLFSPSAFRSHIMRYYQPAKSLPHLYLPALVNWKKVVKDPALEVWITEGEKKAASLCSLGVPCVAVSGVWAWTSKKAHEPLLPELRALGCAKRPFVLCFDSDADANAQIKGALSALALALERLGASVRLCQLTPFKEGEKVGLDDFIVHHKKQALKQLVALEKEPLGLSAALQSLNAELLFVEEQQSFYHLKTHKFATAQLLLSTILSDRMIQVYDRSGNPKAVSVVAEWMKWPQRRVVPRLEYRPGEPDVLAGDGAYNLWRGWGVEPKAGSTRLFDELVDYLTQDLTDEQRQWWLGWLAYPLQNPGTKMFTSTVIFSHHQGTGKTLMGYTLGRIYGANYIEVSQEQLHSAFNSWSLCRQFIIGDEITGSDKRSDADRLKYMVTRNRVLINQKYQPEYELDDVCNYYLTTNQPDAVYLENTDRRNFIIEVSKPPLRKEFYSEYDEWYRTEKATAAVFHKLLNYKITNFDPRAAAPQTAAKVAMGKISGFEVDAIVRDMVRDPKAVLTIAGQPVERELFTLAELSALLDTTGRIGRLSIAKALRRQGHPQPWVCKVHSGNKELWAVTDFERWQKADHATRVANYNGPVDKIMARQAKLQAKKANGAVKTK